MAEVFSGRNQESFLFSCQRELAVAVNELTVTLQLPPHSLVVRLTICDPAGFVLLSKIKLNVELLQMHGSAAKQ